MYFKCFLKGKDYILKFVDFFHFISKCFDLKCKNFDLKWRFIHYGIFYAKSSSAQQSFGILSGFVLLGNIALLSQIYHLGDDTALAFLSVGIVLLILAFCLKSFVIYLQGYIFAAIGYF
ncbi:DUF2157 domain-containing protein [Helicobacter apodemus]|uniref:DUF2157 domain-containing protein n=1 Tax=Helicobacter apodemus TaxID=135569 RepID=A0A4U8UH28_9HELI|nr:DUF2157 domain-containing protein [Helicobacter apodemus]